MRKTNYLVITLVLFIRLAALGRNLPPPSSNHRTPHGPAPSTSVFTSRPDYPWEPLSLACDQVAPDGVTIIPVVYDLARSTALATGYPGQPLSFTDKSGYVYIADGEVYRYDPQGKQTGLIPTPERPKSITFGKDQKTLYITGHHSLYEVAVP